MRLILTLLAIIILSSCSKKLDTIKHNTPEPVKNELSKDITLEYFYHYNIFNYESKIAASRDTEITNPKHFRIKLPKGLKYYVLNPLTDFGFYYDRKQVIFIKIKLFKNEVHKNDSIVSLTNKQLENLIETEISSAGNRRYNIKDMAIVPGRKHLLIEKGDAFILLYNIKEENFATFSEYVKEFKFIEKHQ